VLVYDTILNAVGEELAQRFGFKWSSLEEFEEALREDIGLPSQKTVLIQLNVKH
jgi:hypothetical protein